MRFHSPARGRKSISLSGEGNETLAVEYSQEALAFCAQLGISGADSEEVFFVQALAHFNLGQYAAAVTIAEKLLAQHPENVLVWCLKGNALERLGKSAEASDAFFAAMERDQCNVAAFKAYQSLIARTCDTNGQIATWESLIRQLPESPFPKACLGDSYFATGRYRDAIAAYRASAGDSACESVYFREKAYTTLIECGYRFIEEENLEEAKSCFGEALAEKMDAYAVLGMIAILQDEDRAVEIEQLLKKAIVELPENKELYSQYDDFLYFHYGESGRNSAWDALDCEHPGLPHLPPDFKPALSQTPR